MSQWCCANCPRQTVDIGSNQTYDLIEVPYGEVPLCELDHMPYGQVMLTQGVPIIGLTRGMPRHYVILCIYRIKANNKKNIISAFGNCVKSNILGLNKIINIRVNHFSQEIGL